MKFRLFFFLVQSRIAIRALERMRQSHLTILTISFKLKGRSNRHSGKMTAHARLIMRFRGAISDSSWLKFAEERTEHRFTLFRTDIDVIRPEIFLMEFVLMEKSEG